VDKEKLHIMPTELGKPFDINWRGRPPHMLDPDVPVWYRFLDKWGWKFQALYYDAFVGGKFYTEKQLEDPMIKMWRALNTKRIDAIAVLPDEFWIIEVSDDPGLRAVGQLQVYDHLWSEDPKLKKPHKLVLVCSAGDPDVLSSATSFGILVYVVPP